MARHTGARRTPVAADPDIDHHAVGFIGHSEGGMVGPIAAVDNARVAFVVMLARLRVPVLALNGSLDRQVPAAENPAAIRVALAGNRDATIEELPGLNHMFQPAVTGALGEYPEIAVTFAPQAMNLMADWILRRFGHAAL